MKTCESCVYWSPNVEAPEEQAEDGKYLCLNSEVGIKTRIMFGCSLHLGAEATDMNVPNHTKGGTMDQPNPNPVDGPTEILIVTYYKDFPWLDYALKCIARHCKGFQGITIALPDRDFPAFDKMWGAPCGGTFRINNIGGRLVGFNEVPGKGMLQHMVMMAEADLIVPHGTKYVLHMDADCMFRMPTTPEHYFWQDKPYYLVRSWDSLGSPDPHDPTRKIVSDCAQWKGPTETQLGFATPWYTMCMNTAVFPVEFYRPYREHIAHVHRRPFDDHMLAGRNEFPQTSMDWTAMGAWAKQFMPERFTWFDVCDGNPYPVDRKKAYWSHGGITDEIRAEIEGFLK